MGERFNMFNFSRIWNIRESLKYLVGEGIIEKPKGRYLDLGTAQGVGAHILRKDYGVEIVAVEALPQVLQET